MKFLLLILVSMNLSATAVNKTQLCESFSSSFLNSSELFSEEGSCFDAEYALLSFKQLLLTKCDIDQDDIEIAKIINNEVKKCKINQIKQMK